MEEDKFYDRYYYLTSCGSPYDDKEKWEAFFGNMADRIVQDINPQTVLDAGCAYGYLVSALRQRGVEAYGIDISTYAIEQVPEPVKQYCKVASILEPLTRSYDLIISIEVLEHLQENESRKAIENLCAHTQDFIFASTPYDYKEATHFNVQPTHYWVKLFANSGFYRDVNFETSFIVDHAIRFRKTKEPMSAIISDYEQAFFKNYVEKKTIRNELISARAALAERFTEAESLLLMEKSQQIERANQQIEQLQLLLTEKQTDAEKLLDSEEGYKQKVAELNELLEGKDQLLGKLQENLNDLDDYHLKQLDQHATQTYRAIEEKDTIIRQLQNELKQSKFQYLQELESQANQLSELITAKENLMGNINEYSEQLKKLLAEKEEQVKKLTKLQNERDSFAENLKEVTEINDILKAKLVDTYREKEEIEKKAYQLNSEVGNAKNQNTSLFTQYQASEAELNRIKDLKGFKFLWKYYKVRDTLLMRNAGDGQAEGPKANRYSSLKSLLKLPWGALSAPAEKEIIASINADSTKVEIDEVNTSEHFEKATILELEREFFSKNPIYNRKLAYNPLVSVVVAVFNTPIDCLNEMINSVINQTYKHFELIILNASPDNKSIASVIDDFVNSDNRIVTKVITNTGIAGNTNVGVEMATGEFIALLDHDDIITPNALFEVAVRLQEDKNAYDFFYSDKDMMLADGRTTCNPLYKPQWSPEIMLSANYLTHFCIIRRKLIVASGMLDSTTDGSQDWDIFLKVSQLSDRICHIPEKLYHWRIIPTSVASGIGAKPYALKAQITSIQNHFNALGYNATIKFEDIERHLLKVEWHGVEVKLVTLIVNHTSGSTAIYNFLEELYKHRSELSFQVEVITIAHSDFTLEARFSDVKVRKANALNVNEDLNLAVKESKGEIVIFLDSQVTFADSQSINELVTWAAQKQYGVIAPKIINPNRNILSTGLVINGNYIMDAHQNTNFIHYSCFGSSEWYRNITAARIDCFAVKADLFKEFGYFDASLDEFAPIEFCLRLLNSGYRHVYNPFSIAQKEMLADLNRNVYKGQFSKIRTKYDVKDCDRYWNINLQLNNPIPTENQRKVNKIAANQSNTTGVTGWEKYSSDAISIAQNYDFSQDDLQKNLRILNSHQGNLDIRSANWFLPPFEYIYYAGLYTIFRLANYMQSVKNVDNTFVIVGGSQEMEIYEKIVEAFPGLKDCSVVFIHSLSNIVQVPYADASVCSFWTTAYYLLRFNNTKRKFYFIQDFEPLFYPAGSTYGQTEASYNFNFYGLTNTQALKELYEDQYGGKAKDLKPCIDTNVFYPAKTKAKDDVFRVFFYGRPGHPRNGFELGSAALKILKSKLKDRVEIYCAGSDWNPEDYGLGGIVTNIGRMDFEQTADLYRVCHVGLVMMFTKHPSYLPFELMACGCAVVSNFNEATKWFLKNGENCLLSEASATRMSESIESLLMDEELRSNLVKNANRNISENHTSWDVELGSLYSFMCSLDNGTRAAQHSALPMQVENEIK